MNAPVVAVVVPVAPDEVAFAVLEAPAAAPEVVEEPAAPAVVACELAEPPTPAILC